MPKSKNLIVGRKRSASESNSEISKTKFSLSDLDQCMIPKPLFNFLKIMVPQVQVFQKQQKKDAIKTVWHRWEQMDSSLKQPFYLMADQEDPNHVQAPRDSQNKKEEAVQSQSGNNTASFKFNSNKASGSFSCEIIQPKEIQKHKFMESDFVNGDLSEFDKLFHPRNMESILESGEIRSQDIKEAECFLNPAKETSIVQKTFVELKKPSNPFIQFLSAKNKECASLESKYKFKHQVAVEHWNNLRDSSPEKKKYQQIFIQDKQKYEEEMEILLADPEVMLQNQKIGRRPQKSKKLGRPKIQVSDYEPHRKNIAPEDRKQIFLEFKRGGKGGSNLNTKLRNINGKQIYEIYQLPLPYSDSIFIFKCTEGQKQEGTKMNFEKWNALTYDQKQKYKILMQNEKIVYDAQMAKYIKYGFYLSDQPVIKQKWSGNAQLFYMTLIKLAGGANYFMQNNEEFIQTLWNSIQMKHVPQFKQSFPEYEFLEVPNKIQQKVVKYDIRRFLSNSHCDSEQDKKSKSEIQSDIIVVKNPVISSDSSVNTIFEMPNQKRQKVIIEELIIENTS